jgi:hypothetical protein
MARKPENTFIASVHKHLREVYFEKMFNPYRSGTPDVWYSGNKEDLWAEYKFLQSIPVKVDIRLDLSELQKKWLRDRYYEGRNVCVICGCKSGGVIFTDLSWETPVSPEQFTAKLKTRQEIAQYIHHFVGDKSNALNKNNLQNSPPS